MKNDHSQGREPHPIDVYVGNRVRLRRVYLGYSQDRVAKALGVTFQQIQKYENASNRIGVSGALRRPIHATRLMTVRIIE